MNHIAPPPLRRMNIAVIGTGIAGMSAAWLLNRNHDVTIFEKNGYVGGHSNTVYAARPDGSTPVDTGFIVYNERNYPNLVALFEHLDVPTKDSDMSFAASLRGGGFEYAGTNLNGLLGQRRNTLRPSFWRMISDVLRFYRDAPALLANPSAADLSLGRYLHDNGYSRSFIDNHLLPMGAAIWSTTAPEMEAYPAQAFIRFFQSHGLLLVKDRPQWRTVDGGSREYVKRLTAGYRDRIQFGGVRSVRREGEKVLIEDAAGTISAFDHVVIATHADEAYALIADPSDLETRYLGGWRYTHNRAVLHCDPSLMPKRKRVWSSWNFIEDARTYAAGPLCVTYWMNLLQGLETEQPLFVTLNPVREPAAKDILAEFDYTHPYFDTAALQAQQRMWALQGERRTWFCGSYFGYGFHEDALQSGLAVAEQLGGARRPWSVPNENGRIHVSPAQVMAA